MNTLGHSSAQPSHYNKEAEHYDVLNEANSKIINQTIEKLLKENKAKTVLDLSCGSGSQVFWLAQCGHEVTGVDINTNMLKIAKSKKKKEDIKLIKGDMRTTQLGKFDAVITIFNAVGHLTKIDFEKTIKNIHSNLIAGGIYIFDILNFNYFAKSNNITKLTIDWEQTVADTKIRKVQYSTLDEDGILTSHTFSHSQKISRKIKIFRDTQTLQIYTAEQLKKLLTCNSFKVLKQYDINGSPFSKHKTERILTIAKKK